MENSREKDSWDKLKIGGFVAIPIVIAIIGLFANSSLKSKDIEVRMIELAVGILKEDPKAEDSSETPLMREWAIKVINEYSTVTISTEAKKELEENPLPETVSWTWPSEGTATATTNSAVPVIPFWQETQKGEYSFYGVEIQSHPPNAFIYIDGDLKGMTNKVVLMPAGEHEIKLQLYDKERIIRIKPSKTSTVNIDFDKEGINETK